MKLSVDVQGITAHELSELVSLWCAVQCRGGEVTTLCQNLGWTIELMAVECPELTAQGVLLLRGILDRIPDHETGEPREI